MADSTTDAAAGCDNVAGAAADDAADGRDSKPGAAKGRPSPAPGGLNTPLAVLPSSRPPDAPPLALPVAAPVPDPPSPPHVDDPSGAVVAGGARPGDRSRPNVDRSGSP